MPPRHVLLKRTRPGVGTATRVATVLLLYYYNRNTILRFSGVDFLFSFEVYLSISGYDQILAS